MSYTARRQELTARALSTTEETFTALWAEDPEQAIDMAEVVNHIPTLTKALTSGVARLQSRVVASSSLPRIDPALLAGMVHDLPMDVRRVLYRRIRSYRLRPLAEALLAPVHAAWGTAEAASLLPVCGRAMVEEWLPTLEHAVSPVAVAKRHPELTHDRALRELSQLEIQDRDNWWRRNGGAINEVVGHDPGRVLDLVEQFGPSNWLPFSHVRSGVLARTDAGRFIRLMEDRTCQLSRPAYLALAIANPPELVGLGRSHLRQVLRALPPSRRAAFFDAVHAHTDMSQVEVADDILRLLPRERRAQEARRMRAIADTTGNETRSRLLTAFLPFDEAQEALTQVTYSGEATERALGHPLLIDCADKSFRLAELLPWLADRLKREQDPVRLAAIQALSQASPRSLGEARELGQIAADAFNARDFSDSTGYAIAALCVKLLTHNDSQLALDILGDWWRRSGWSALGRLDEKLRRGQEHEVYRALEPAITAAVRRADFQPTIAFVQAFGRRAWRMPDLLEPLWTAIGSGTEHEARQAIRLLLADPRARNERVQRILELEPTAAFLSAVLNVLQFARTDLLDLVLGEQLPQGRFNVSEIRTVPLGLKGTVRWLPEQRVRYAELVTLLADDEFQDRDTLALAVRTLGTIHGPAKLGALRYLDSEDELVVQAAIAVLPDSDDPLQAMRLLVAKGAGMSLSDNRGQAELASMYTVRRCARRVVPSQLAGVLLEALRQGGQVTVTYQPPSGAPTPSARKELIRLASDFRLPGAVDLLRQVWSAENQHRDVRAACAYAALSWLDEPAAWDLLREAVHGPREVSMQTLRAQPWSVPTKHRAGVAGLIKEVATGPDDRLRTEALAALGNWVAWYPEAFPVLRAAITNLDERAAWQAAATGLARQVTSLAGEAAVIEALHAMLQMTGPDAEADRDRPTLRRARAIIVQLCTTWNRKSPMRDAAIRVVEALIGYDEIRRELVELRLTTVRVHSAEVVEDLRAIEDLVIGRPALATSAGLRITGGTYNHLWRWNADAVLTAAQSLDNGHIVVGILSVGGPYYGWPEPWRELVRRLRRHTDRDVRDAAMAIATAPE